MFYLVIIVFVLGFVAIALEHQLSVDKAAIALVTGVTIWVCIAFGSDTLISHDELVIQLGDISEILFYLLASMTVIEIIDSHGGFSMLSKTIKTTNKVKLLWIFSFLAFFLSAILDNLTATILMITLMWKLIGGKHTRWFFAGMIVIAANAGGAWSPIGDVTTIMLWIGGQVNAWSIIKELFVPSLVCMLIPLIIVSFTIKGNTIPPSGSERAKSLVPTTDRERWVILITGVVGSLFVPVFKYLTHLPPYMGALLVVGIMWIMLEIMHRKKQREIRMRLTLIGILKKIDTPTIFFLLGILLAVAGLQSAGHLEKISVFLNDNVKNIYAINIAIGALGSIVDNVPLVAGAMGMYESPETVDAAIANAEYMQNFVKDGPFWKLLAYCAGTGGSILIIGSAAGIAAMGLTKMDFIWYFKKMSLLAIIGYLSGVLAYFLIS